MHLGERRDADGEVADAADEFDELGGVDEVAGVGAVGRRVASEREDVLDARVAVVVMSSVSSSRVWPMQVRCGIVGNACSALSRFTSVSVVPRVLPSAP